MQLSASVLTLNVICRKGFFGLKGSLWINWPCLNFDENTIGPLGIRTVTIAILRWMFEKSTSIFETFSKRYTASFTNVCPRLTFSIFDRSYSGAPSLIIFYICSNWFFPYKLSNCWANVLKTVIANNSDGLILCMYVTFRTGA